MSHTSYHLSSSRSSFHSNESLADVVPGDTMRAWRHKRVTCASGSVVPDLQSGGCRFESRPGLLRTKVYSAFHPSGVGKWVPAAAGKAKAGMAHSDCGWTCGCGGKTVTSLENTCHTWALVWRWFTMKRCYIKCMDLYLYDQVPKCDTWIGSRRPVMAALCIGVRPCLLR